MSDDDNDPEGYVTTELCEAYRQTVSEQMGRIEERVDGLRNTIITGLSIATAIMSLVVLVTNLIG